MKARLGSTAAFKVSALGHRLAHDRPCRGDSRRKRYRRLTFPVVNAKIMRVHFPLTHLNRTKPKRVRQARGAGKRDRELAVADGWLRRRVPKFLLVADRPGCTAPTQDSDVC